MDTTLTKEAAPQQGQPSQQQGQQAQAQGGSPDQQFEQGFFQLAYDKLQSKLYNLLPHMVGFEVVNKAADNTKAVGVFGFKSANGQILYVPAFFINGKVKDLDVMYSKNSNQFYPLNEDFAELFLKDDVTGLGEISDQKRKEMERYNSPTDMRDMVFPPRTGRISYASVIDFIREGDDNIKAAAWGLMNEYPEFTESLYRFYEPTEVAAALQPVTKQAAARRPLEVHDPESAPKELKGEAMAKGFVVVDQRGADAKSRYGLLNYSSKFTNPSKPGFYSYLTKLGTLKFGLVLFPTSLYAGFKTGSTIVVDLTSPERNRSYKLDGEESRVFVREAIEVADYKEIHKSLINPVDAEASFDKTYVLINEQLETVEPFRVTMNYKDQTGLRRLRVQPGGANCAVPFYPDKERWEKANRFDGKSEHHHEVTLVFTKKEGGPIERRSNVLYLPKGYRLLEITTYRPYSESEEGKQWKAGEPGSMCDLTSFLSQHSILPLSVHSNGSEYFVSVGAASKKYDDAISAKIGMIKNFGLDQDDAKDLIDGVRGNNDQVTGYFKYAVTGDYTHPLFDEPESMNELGQPTTFGIPYQAVAPTDHYYQGDPTQQGLAVTNGPDQSGWGNAQNDVQNASNLAAGGQKQIFDTSAIAMISKYVDPTSKVTNYVPNFVDTLDKLGRMLFMIYWETDKFHKMYGTDELPELIELVKNVFRNLGDLVIFLKRKFPDISINVSEQDSSEG